MLATLLAWSVIGFVAVSIGQLAARVFQKISGDTTDYNVFDFFFAGLGIIAGLAGIWSLWLPVDEYALLFVLLLAIGNWSLRRKSFKRLVAGPFGKVTLVVAILIGAGILLHSVSYPMFYDAHLYHTQNIIWNSTFPVVPGLANLHERLGFNSNATVLGALFSFEFVVGQILYPINGIVLFILGIWIVHLSMSTRSNWRVAPLILFALIFEEYGYTISSATSDLIANALSLFILLRLASDERDARHSMFIYTVLPLFCVTLKLSTFPVVLVALLSLPRGTVSARLKGVILAAAVAALIVGPWLVRNAIMTGHPVFPIPGFDLFNFDWEVPQSTVVEARNWIYSWARFPGVHQQAVLAMNLKDWFPHWWDSLYVLNKPILLLCALSVPVVPFLILNNWKQGVLTQERINLFIVWVVALIGVTYWLITAPAVRFAYAFVLVCASCPLLLWRSPAPLERVKVKIAMPLLVIAGLWIMVVGVHAARKDFGIVTLLIPKEASSAASEFRSTEIGGIQIFSPLNGDQCFDKFPCAPAVSSHLRLRGTTLGEGFFYDPRMIIKTASHSFVLDNGVVQQDGTTIHNVPGDPAIKLLATDSCVELVTLSGRVWNSCEGWRSVHAITDNTGSYYLLDGRVYREGILLYAATEPNTEAISLKINDEGFAQFETLNGSVWSSKDSWLPQAIN